MYSSKFAADMEDMLTTLHNSGLQLGYINYFLSDFDKFCADCFPHDDILTADIAETWIRNGNLQSKAHMSRRVRTMKHLGIYQQSLGKPSYVIAYAVHYDKSEEPNLFSDEQLTEFFEKVDTQITTTKTYPHSNIIFPVMFRLIYCCGLRSSEACNLKVKDVDLTKGSLSIYNSKGFKDRMIFMSDDVSDLCARFNEYYSRVIPGRTHFFQPSSIKSCYKSYRVGKIFDTILKKTSLSNTSGKKYTAHGLRHLFAVQNIKKCVEQGENFGNWMQYLRKHMGHKHIRYTMYYLHITSQLFPVYSDKLRQLEEGIGVVYAEE